MNEIIKYRKPESDLMIEIRYDKQDLWLTQKSMAELFDKNSDTIGLHIKNIYTDRELDENSTTEYFSVVRKEGNRDIKRKLKFYNIDAIISVGYRVSSYMGTQFRIWATKILRKRFISF